MKRLLAIILLIIPLPALAFMADEEIAIIQRAAAGWPIGDRIAFWAEQFIDVPYDPDPVGRYVRKKVIVADDMIDCMYHVFRSVELSFGKTPQDSVNAALDLRFHGSGRIEDGKVINYEERFRYGEDMIESGKWGKDITSELGAETFIRGRHGSELLKIIGRKTIPGIIEQLRNGDIVFFVKDQQKRTVGEVIGHIGIIKKEEEQTYLISASGIKNKGGRVKKILLKDYAAEMPFVGIKITRME